MRPVTTLTYKERKLKEPWVCGGGIEEYYVDWAKLIAFVMHLGFSPSFFNLDDAVPVQAYESQCLHSNQDCCP